MKASTLRNIKQRVEKFQKKNTLYNRWSLINGSLVGYETKKSTRQFYRGIWEYWYGKESDDTINGVYTKIGNAKIGDDTVVVSFGTCWTCPNRWTCPMGKTGECYDNKACSQYKYHNKVGYQNLVWFLGIKDLWIKNESLARQKIRETFKTILEKRFKKCKPVAGTTDRFIRFNEAGDVADNVELAIVYEIAKLGAEIGFSSYLYTHSDLDIGDIDSEVLFINDSTNKNKYHHNFKVVFEDTYTLKQGETYCECFEHKEAGAESSTCKGCNQCKLNGKFNTTVELIH